ncbi:MAG: sugar transferase [Desulfobacteraceae bacterium]|jgi:lipopolysaccharide/colanic/teichoic acid biosynthesis glycosyltransferase
MEIGKTATGLTGYLSQHDGSRKAGYQPKMPALDSFFIKRIPVWKRIFDIVVSLIALIVLFPVFILIATLIKTVSPGPSFFRQKRVGCGGAVFNLYKFRTMKSEADPDIHKQYLSKLIESCKENKNSGDPMIKLNNDTRIIKFGNFIRASGLDELPQLLNVLMGQMSLVGPRPAIPYEVEHYKLWYKSRFDVVPGLTGLWQISGKNKLGFNEMMRLDIQYAIKRSFLLDCKILLKTPIAVYSQLKEMKK